MKLNLKNPKTIVTILAIIALIVVVNQTTSLFELFDKHTLKVDTPLEEKYWVSIDRPVGENWMATWIGYTDDNGTLIKTDLQSGHYRILMKKASAISVVTYYLVLEFDMYSDIYIDFSAYKPVAIPIDFSVEENWNYSVGPEIPESEYPVYEQETNEYWETVYEEQEQEETQDQTTSESPSETIGQTEQTTETPGFEISLIFLSLIIYLFVNRRKKA